LLVATAALAGCFANEAHDTLGTMTATTGRVMLDTALATEHGEGPHGGTETFTVRAAEEIGLVIHADMWPDERLTVTVLDGAGAEAYRATFGTDSFDERHVAQRLTGVPGSWSLTWEANEDLFRVARVSVLAADGADPTETVTFQEDRGHHFLRVTGSMAGWGGTAEARIVGPDGSTVWSRTVSGTTGPLRERVDATEGPYRLEVEPGDWTGVADLRVTGVFQGEG